MKPGKLARYCIPLLVALVTASCGSAAGSNSGNGDGPIKIGVVVADTGAYAFAGVVSHTAMEVAVHHVNDDGGINGRKLELDFQDDGSETAQALTLVGRFASDPDYVAVIGPTSTPESLALSPVVNARRIPLLAATVVSSKLLDAGPWAFKTAADPAGLMTELAKVVNDKLSLKRVAVVFGRENEAQVDQKDGFADAMKEAGVQVVTDIGVLNKETNFSDAAGKVVAAKPDALFVAMTADVSANFIVQARKAGLPHDVTLLGTSQSVSPRYLDIGGRDIEGTIAGTDYDPTLDNEVNKRFVEDYTAKAGKAPDSYAALGYQAILQLRNAMESITGDITRESLQKALLADRKFTGVLGNGTCTVTDRVPSYGAAVLQIKDGTFATLG